MTESDNFNDEQKDFLGEIMKSNKRMIELVDSFLSVSRMELGTFVVEPEKILITEIADDTINELRSKIESKKLIFKTNYGTGLSKMNLDRKLTHII